MLVVFAARHMPGQPCPFPGRHVVLPRYLGCELDVLSGCESPSSLTVTSTCENKAGQFTSSRHVT